MAGGSRIPDPTEDPNIHDTDYMHASVVRRVLKWGNWLSRCTGTQEWVKRDWQFLQDEARKAGQDPTRLVFGHTNFCYFTPFKERADAEAVQQQYFARNMGDRRNWDHLRECYFTGTLADQLARMEDLAEASLDYMVLGPLTAEPARSTSWRASSCLASREIDGAPAAAQRDNGASGSAGGFTLCWLLPTQSNPSLAEN